MKSVVVPPEEYNGRVLRSADVVPLKQVDVNTFVSLVESGTVVSVVGPRIKWWVTTQGVYFEFDSADIDGECLTTIPAFKYMLVTSMIKRKNVEERKYLQLICFIIKIDQVGIEAVPCGIDLWYGDTPNPQWSHLM